MPFRLLKRWPLKRWADSEVSGWIEKMELFGGDADLEGAADFDGLVGVDADLDEGIGL